MRSAAHEPFRPQPALRGTSRRAARSLSHTNPQGNAVTTSKLSRRVLLAVTSLALVAAAGISAATPFRVSSGLHKFRAMEAMSYELGSKRAVGYFQKSAGKCQLVLMIAELVDPDVAKPGSAARLSLAMAPGQSATLASEEGQGMVVTCGADAETMQVERAAARS
jgi:hypothetical protein